MGRCLRGLGVALTALTVAVSAGRSDAGDAPAPQQAAAWWKLAPGQILRFKCRRMIKASGDQGTAAWTLNWTWTHKVAERNEFDMIRLQTVVEEFDGTYHLGGQNETFKSGPDAKPPASEYLKPFAALVGKPFMITVNEQGLLFDTSQMKDVLLDAGVKDLCQGTEAMVEMLQLQWSLHEGLQRDENRTGEASLTVHVPPALKGRPEIQTFLKNRRKPGKAPPARGIVVEEFDARMDLPLDPEKHSTPKPATGGSQGSTQGSGVAGGGMMTGGGGKPKHSGEDGPKPHGRGTLRFSIDAGSLQKLDLRQTGSGKLNNAPYTIEATYSIENAAAPVKE